jgi:hypothetical protein
MNKIALIMSIVPADRKNWAKAVNRLWPEFRCGYWGTERFHRMVNSRAEQGLAVRRVPVPAALWFAPHRRHHLFPHRPSFPDRRRFFLAHDRIGVCCP